MLMAIAGLTIYPSFWDLEWAGIPDCLVADVMAVGLNVS